MSTPTRPPFIKVDVEHVRELGSPGALVLSLIRFRAAISPDGWAAKYAVIAFETGLSERTVRRACSDLRARGWITATRASSNDATLVWLPVCAGQPDLSNMATSEMSNMATSPVQSGHLPEMSNLATSSYKTEEDYKEPPLPPEGDQQQALPMLALVADPKPAVRQRSVKRATQLPESWRPNDGHAAFVAENGLNGGYELAQFRDYHIAKGSTMKDWDAAFRTWLRRAGTGPSRAGAGGRSSDDENAWMRRRPAR